MGGGQMRFRLAVRTCGGPSKIKKNAHPELITALLRHVQLDEVVRNLRRHFRDVPAKTKTKTKTRLLTLHLWGPIDFMCLRVRTMPPWIKGACQKPRPGSLSQKNLLFGSELRLCLMILELAPKNKSSFGKASPAIRPWFTPVFRGSRNYTRAA